MLFVPASYCMLLLELPYHILLEMFLVLPPCRYHDMPDVIDFLVLRQSYDEARSRIWRPSMSPSCSLHHSTLIDFPSLSRWNTCLGKPLNSCLPRMFLCVCLSNPGLFFRWSFPVSNWWCLVVWDHSLSGAISAWVSRQPFPMLQSQVRHKRLCYQFF